MKQVGKWVSVSSIGLLSCLLVGCSAERRQTESVERVSQAVNQGDVRPINQDAGSLPTPADPGLIAYMTDKQRGFWFDTGSNWVSMSGQKVNVKEFGAKGDGSNDDAGAIQAAIDAVPGGGTIFFPPGIYLVGQSLKYANGHHFVGSTGYGLREDGGPYGTTEYGTIIRPKGLLYWTPSFPTPPKSLFEVVSGCVNMSSWSHLELHLEVDGEARSINGINTEGCSQCLISDVHIKGLDEGSSFSGHGVGVRFGISVAGDHGKCSYGNLVQNSLFEYLGEAVHFEAGANFNTVQNVSVLNCEKAIVMDGKHPSTLEITDSPRVLGSRIESVTYGIQEAAHGGLYIGNRFEGYASVPMQNAFKWTTNSTFKPTLVANYFVGTIIDEFGGRSLYDFAGTSIAPSGTSSNEDDRLMLTAQGAGAPSVLRLAHQKDDCNDKNGATLEFSHQMSLGNRTGAIQYVEGANNANDANFHFTLPDDNGDSTTRLTIMGSSGNVGIGVSSPTNERLEVNGRIRASNLSGSGYAYACVDEQGTLIRSSTPCPQLQQ